MRDTGEPQGTTSTGGGAYVGGNIDTGGGDFTGRDKHVQGNEIRGNNVAGDNVNANNVTTTNQSGGVNVGNARIGSIGSVIGGDYVAGDKVGGDTITVGNITGSTGVAIGRGAQVNVHHGLGGDNLAAIFHEIYRSIDARPADPHVDPSEVHETVRKIEQEVTQGETANPTKVERWLRSLLGMAPDIFEVTAEALINPVSGVATAIKKIAQKMRGEPGAAA